MLQIRYNIFETNSSSTHAMIMCSDEDYKKLISGEYMISGYEYPNGEYNSFVARKEVYDWFWNEYYPQNRDYLESDYGIIDSSYDIETILAEKDIAYTFENFGESYEHFDDEFTTSHGKIVHAFGYYGNW